MLYNYKKYKTFNLTYVDIKHKKSKILSLYPKYIVIKAATFFRKMFFRTLLLYINVLYCNFFYTPDSNYYYFTVFMHSTYTNYHPSFYFKCYVVL